eukprot:6208833-Pleurochrysis_carterae.AAC.1
MPVAEAKVCANAPSTAAVTRQVPISTCHAYNIFRSPADDSKVKLMPPLSTKRVPTVLRRCR